MELCVFIEKARAQFSNKPIIITSGNRPEKVNQAVGGAATASIFINQDAAPLTGTSAAYP
jgi:hypothetical protein